MKPAPRSRFALPGFCLAAAASARLLAEATPVVEWHRTTLFPAVASALQRLGGWTTWTIGEPIAAVAIVAAVVLILKRRLRALPPVLAAAGIVIFAFYAAWGLGYHYAPLSGRLAPLPSAAKSKERLIAVAERSARLVTAIDPLAPASNAPDGEFLARVNAGLTRGYAVLPAAIEASPVRSVSFGPTKGSLVSFALSRLQISGFYFPWTGEAQINAQMPRSEWPRTAAHERAHQRGFARENEASVAGLLACLASDDLFVRYSGALGLFASFDRDLAKVDREARKGVWALLPKRAIRDLEEEFRFWKQFEGAPARISEKVNDTYLKAQGIQSGVISYSETTSLLLQALETKGLVDGPLKDLR